MTESTGSLADVIRENRDRILQRFVGDTARDLAPDGLSRSNLVDHIPAFLEKIVRQLDATPAEREARGPMSAKALARDHGEQRWALGFDLEAVTREYALLRRCIMGVAAEMGHAPSLAEYEVVVDCLEEAVASATTAYAQQRNREVSGHRERLEFLEEAGRLLSQTEQARVESASRAKDEFVAMVSHELRTPLNAILGWLRLMRSGSLDDRQRQHAFEVIERNAEAQDRLVADLLDISRVITGKIRINLSQVDLSDLVEIAVEAVRPAANAKRIRIEVDLDRDHSILRGDAERLQQVAWNLIGNAVKFTPKAGRVMVRLRRVESDLELVVEDNGEGIEEGFLPHVFEIFQQSDRSSSRPHGGLGIGLSIVKHIVDLHGGSLRASSAGKGAGATFSMRIPITTLISSTLGITRAAPATTTPRDLEAIPSGLTNLRVLVVEDDADARELVTVVLESSGMEVRGAESFAEALLVLADYAPDVICSDIGLLEQDGYALIRTIRALSDPAKKDIPAIALTAFGGSDDRKRALLEGFNVHLTKPVEPALLVRTVLELAGRL